MNFKFDVCLIMIKNIKDKYRVFVIVVYIIEIYNIKFKKFRLKEDIDEKLCYNKNYIIFFLKYFLMFILLIILLIRWSEYGINDVNYVVSYVDVSLYNCCVINFYYVIWNKVIKEYYILYISFFLCEFNFYFVCDD